MAVPFQGLWLSDGHPREFGGNAASNSRPAAAGNPGRLMARGLCYGTCEGIA